MIGDVLHAYPIFRNLQEAGKAYCGRRGKIGEPVNCPDCLAAIRADAQQP